MKILATVKVLAIATLLGCSFSSVSAQVNMEKGDIELQSGGPLSFAPDGVLLVGDTKAAMIHAVQTNEAKGDPSQVSVDIADLNGTLSGLLGVEADEIRIHDIAANPLTGTTYISVSRGTSPDAPTLLFRVTNENELEEFSLEGVQFSSVELPNVPDPNARGRRGPYRAFSITDIGFVDNRVIVAGLSNEEFSSNLRAIDYPFSDANDGTTVEVYHGAHGRFETNAPVRTFTPVSINNEPYIVAAYTCTPLVKFPLAELGESEKLTGTTIAELGNWNQPLDMFVYEKEGTEFILMANTKRGTMKISTKDIERSEGIEDRVEGTAGQDYETVESLDGVVQLARLNETHAVVVMTVDGKMSLRSVELP